MTNQPRQPRDNPRGTTGPRQAISGTPAGHRGPHFPGHRRDTAGHISTGPALLCLLRAYNRLVHAQLRLARTHARHEHETETDFPVGGLRSTAISPPNLRYVFPMILASRGPSGGVLGVSWAFLEAFWAILEAS